MKILKHLTIFLIWTLVGCAGPMRRLDKSISGDAGAVLYQYHLRKCPALSAELPMERTHSNRQIKADNFYSRNIFVKRMRYCHGFTKYSFEEISDKDKFYIFSAYAHINREGSVCSLDVATPADIECESKDPKACEVVKEQEKYIESFIEILTSEEVDKSRLEDVELFQNADEWESWCHKRIRLKTFR